MEPGVECKILRHLTLGSVQFETMGVNLVPKPEVEKQCYCYKQTRQMLANGMRIIFQSISTA